MVQMKGFIKYTRNIIIAREAIWYSLREETSLFGSDKCDISEVT